MDNEILLKEQFEQIGSEQVPTVQFNTDPVGCDELPNFNERRHHHHQQQQQQKENENEEITLKDSNKTSSKFVSNIASREKRIRKQKSYDDDFVLFNLSSSSHSHYAQSQSVNNKQQNANNNNNSSYASSEQSLNQSLMNTNEYSEIKYHIGDLVWAKVGGHPWWPCMITSAPSNEVLNECITHVKYIGTTRPKRMFYVQFFGTSIEHAWVPEGCLIDYGGIEAFKTYAQDQVDQALTKSAKEKLAERFQLKVALSRRENWERAVKEADFAMKKSVSERKLYFTKKYQNQNSENQVGSSQQANKTKSTPSEERLLIDTAQISNEQPQIKQEYEDVDFMLSLDNNNNNNNYNQKNKNAFEYSLNQNHSYSSLYVNNKDELNKIKSEQMDHSSIQQTYLTSDGHVQKRANVRKQSKPRLIPTSKLELQQQQQRRKRTRSKTKNDQFYYADLKGDLYEYEDNEPNFDTNNFEHDADNDDDDDDDDDQSQDEIENDDNQDNYNDTSDENYSDVEGINKKKQRRTNNKVPLNHQASTTENEANTICLRQRSNQSLLAQGVYSHQPLVPPSEPQESQSSLQTSSLVVKRNRPKANDKNTNESIAALVNQIKESAMESNSFTSVGFKKSNANKPNSTETYLIDRYKYAVRHIRQGLSVEEACNKYRISKGALLKCLSGGTAPRGKKTRLSESEENEIVEWLINNKDLKYNEAIHLVFEQVERIFHQTQRPNPFNNGKPSMDWWYDFLSRHPQIMASKPEWLRRGKVNDQYIKDVQSGRLRCTKFRRALLSAIQYIRSLSDAAIVAVEAANSDTSSKSSANHQTPLASNLAHINQQKSAGTFGKVTSSTLNANMLTDGNMNNKSQHHVHHHQQQQQTSAQINAQPRKKTKTQIMVNVNSLVKVNNLKYKVLSQPNDYNQQQPQTHSIQKHQKVTNAASALRRLGKASDNKEVPAPTAPTLSSMNINDKSKNNSSQLRKKNSTALNTSTQIATKLNPIDATNKSIVMNRTLQITHKLNHEQIVQVPNNDFLLNAKQMNELEKPFNHHNSTNLSMNAPTNQQVGDNEDAENEYSLNQDEFDLVSNLNDYENNLENLMMNSSTTPSATNAQLIKANHLSQMNHHNHNHNNNNNNNNSNLNRNEHEDDDLDRLVACLVDQNDDEHSPINPFDIDINPDSSASHLQTTSTIASSVASSTQSVSANSTVNNHDLFSSIMNGPLHGSNATLNQRNGFTSHMINSSLSIDERLFDDSADQIENELAFGKNKSQSMTSTASDFYHHSSHHSHHHHHHNPSNLLLIEDDDDEEIEEFMNANSNFLNMQSDLNEQESDTENHQYEDEDEEDAQTHITTLHEFA